MLAKILSLADAEIVAEAWRRLAHSVVFVNGCFDCIQPGHVHLFEQARKSSMCSKVFVAVNSDESIRKLKGFGRPIQPLADRMEILAAFENVDYVVSFDELTPLETIKRIKPTIMLRGTEHKGNPVGVEFVESYGGRVIWVERVGDYSTTNMIRKASGAEPIS